MEKFILSFNDASATNLSLSGGKGANLCKMTQAKFPVPTGFIVTTLAFQAFLDSLKEVEMFQNYMGRIAVDSNNIAETSHQIRLLLENTPIPEIISTEIKTSLSEFDSNQYFAIRSSATAEDLPHLSFAGQQDTYLNIAGNDQILDHIRKCWSSLFTERAISYRNENQITHTDVQMAVVLQMMVYPQVSGILFTADPISNNHQVMAINASYGLGEAIVSGMVNPDLIKYSKLKEKILDYQVADKEMMIEAIPGGGTIRKNVAKELSTIPALTDAQIQQLTLLATNVENYYKVPQDLEWAIADERLYLLQTRPITSLFPLPTPKPGDENLHIYFSFGHAQMNTNPISPLGLSFLQLLLPFGRPSLKMAYSPYLLEAGGRLYADLNTILNNKIGRKAFPTIIHVAEPVSANQIQHLVTTPDFLERNQIPSRKFQFSAAREWLIPLIGRVVKALFFDRMDDVPNKVMKRNQHALEMYREKLENTPIPAKIALIEEISARIFYERVVINAPLIGAGFVSQKMINENLVDNKQKDLLKKVQRGLEGNITTEMDLVIADLADGLSSEPELVKLFHKIVNGEVAWNDKVLHAFPLFEVKWCTFMQKFGMRVPGEIDIALPRWQNQPQSLLQMLLSFVENQGSNGHRERFARLNEESTNARHEILLSLKKTWKGKLKVPLIKRLLRVFSVMAPLREHPKYMIVCFMQDIRTELVAIATELVKQGDLENVDDIWFIRLNELHTHFLEHKQPLKQIVSERKQEYQHFAKMTPPRVITSDGEIPTMRLSGENFPEGAFAGSPVSAGIVEGPAHVIMDPALDRLLPGEILVAPFTDPGWTPLFVNAIGLVLETGGLMTHGSVVAREYGIPAVVGITEGTKVIHTGMKIRVNGDLGYVEILS